MSQPQKVIDDIVKEIEKLRRNLKKKNSPQIYSSAEKSLIKAVCYAWTNNHRKNLVGYMESDFLKEVDTSYSEILTATDAATSRSKYDFLLKEIQRKLSKGRQSAYSQAVDLITNTSDSPPAFDKLIPDLEMCEILKRRWIECTTCVESKAPLAAVVMMGGLIEGLLLAKINKEQDKSKIFKSAAAPKNKDGKTLILQDWTLKDYIDVAHELKWISRPAKDVGAIVRDYRNYIHPHKELSHRIHIQPGDAKMFWEISKEISRQLIQ